MARRFAELVCPPEVHAGQRADRVLGELGLMLGSLPPAARKALAAALVLLDQGARLYPSSRGRRFARLGDQVAEAYVRAVLARRRLESYGPDVRAGEAAVTAAPEQGAPGRGAPGRGTPERGTP